MKQELKCEEKFYLEQKKLRLDGASLKLLPDGDGVDPNIHRRKFSLQHDNWSSNGQGFLSLTFSHMDTDSTPWRLVHDRMMLPHPGTHTAERNKEKCDEGCAMLGIDETMLIAVVQDTTASSLNTYDHAEYVSQLRCGAHTTELVSKHATEKTAVEVGLDRIQECLRRARGNKSISRRELLEKYATEEKCRYTKVYLPGTTRWGGKVVMADNFDDLHPALQKFKDEDCPSNDSQKAFTDLLSDAMLSLPIVQAALPVLNLNFQWTQMFTVAHSPTIGLVLLAINRLNAAVLHLHSLEARCTDNQLKKEISEFRKSYDEQLSSYFGEDTTSFWIYTLASFLDPRTHMVINPKQWNSEVKGFLHIFCTEEERFSQAALHAKTSISGGGGSRKKAKTANIVIALSEEEAALAELGHSAQPQYSTAVPVDTEMLKYINHMKSIMLNESDIELLPCPLTFYSKDNFGGDNLPILSRIAAVIFPCSPASGDVERTNSTAGKVLSPSRQSLKSDTVSSIVFLKGVYREQERRPTHRENVAKRNFKKFVAFMGRSCFLALRDKEESEEYFNSLDRLCEWISSEDDYDSEVDEEEVA